VQPEAKAVIMSEQTVLQFQETVKASIHIAQEFSELLEKEKQQLTSTDRDSVNHLLEQKELLIKQLAGYQTKILSFCESAKIEPSYSALRSFLYLKGIAQAEAILQDWTQLKNCLIKNQALNKTNEAILSELIRRNQIKQHIVRSLGKQSDTYAPSGQKQHQTNHGWVEQV
jgi:flagellar biosynthesis/type III secretory pathway chaperone